MQEIMCKNTSKMCYANLVLPERMMQVQVPQKIRVEDSEGRMTTGNFNNVAKMEIRGSGSCSRNLSEIWLVLKSPSRSLKLTFTIAGKGYTFYQLMAQLKDRYFCVIVTPLCS